MRRGARSCAVLLLLALLVGASTALASRGARLPERLPKVKAGTVFPNAGGVVLGETKKAQLVARWGQPGSCVPKPDEICTWQTGLDPATFRPRRGAVSDLAEVRFAELAGFAYYLTFGTSDWKRSKLRGWRTPEGIKIGSTYQALRKAYPKAGWNGGEPGISNRSNWLVQRHPYKGGNYLVRFLVDRHLSKVASAHVLRIEVQWWAPPVECTLAVTAAPGPAGEPTGKRIRGSCRGGTLWYSAAGGRAVPLSLSYEALGDAHISSAKSPFDPACNQGGCQARARDWAVDVTLGFDSATSGVEVQVHAPSGYYALPENPKRLRYTFP